MLLKIVENNDFRDIVIHEGESFVLPGTNKMQIFQIICDFLFIDLIGRRLYRKHASLPKKIKGHDRPRDGTNSSAADDRSHTMVL